MPLALGQRMYKKYFSDEVINDELQHESTSGGLQPRECNDKLRNRKLVAEVVRLERELLKLERELLKYDFVLIADSENITLEKILNNKNLVARIKKKYKRRKPLSRAKLAGRAVRYAVDEGDLPSISTRVCEHCGEQAHHYHHHSYKAVDWLDVVPLCADCHSSIHGRYIPPSNSV